VFLAGRLGLFEASPATGTTVRVADAPTAMVSDGQALLTVAGSKIVLRAPGGGADVIANAIEPSGGLAVDAREIAYVDERRIVRINRSTGAQQVADGIAARPTALAFDEHCVYVVDAATQSLIRLPR
jgi:hypothetical protein